MVFTLSLILAFFVAEPSAHAVGRKRPAAPAVVVEPADQQAFPLRYIELGTVRASSFRLPNGNAVDMNIDLPAIVDSQVNQSAKFRTVSQVAAHSGRHGILTGGITALEMEVLTLGLHFGYRPGGGGGDGGSGSDPSPSPSASSSAGASESLVSALESSSSASSSDVNLTGNLQVKLGTISMDFKIQDSETGDVYGAVTVDQSTAGLDFTFGIDFSGVTIGPEVQLRQKLSEAVRRLVSNAMGSFISAPRVNMLPWEAIVREVDLSRKLVLFDAGVRSGLSASEIYSVYSSCQSSGCLEHYIGDVKVKRALDGSVTGSTPNGYSEAAVKSDPNAAVLQIMKPGDKVYIKYLRGF